MSVTTEYDRKRDELRADLKKCLSKAKELVIGEDITGYDEMREGYSIDVYMAIKNAIDTV